jgi:hypothetical protein
MEETGATNYILALIEQSCRIEGPRLVIPEILRLKVKHAEDTDYVSQRSRKSQVLRPSPLVLAVVKRYYYIHIAVQWQPCTTIFRCKQILTETNPL